MYKIDKDYIISIRRKIHEYPEIGFELPKTVELVKSELDKMGIEYTEKYSKGSVVATINPKNTQFTIGIRADMDALLINEKTDVPFKSKIEGQMHACGHDAHTAMLLGTAKALKSIEDKLKCRVKLIFQPSEEGVSGANVMVNNGVLDDVDIIIGQHIENSLNVGEIGVCKGNSMASSRTIKLEFFGATAHATLPHTGKDALATAVKTYNDIQFMLTREINPFEKHLCSVGKLAGGTTQNVIADYAEMLISLRTYNMELDNYIEKRIIQIAKNNASEIGIKVEVDSDLQCLILHNDENISDCLLKSAEKVVGKEKIANVPQKLGSEDFSHYLRKIRGVFFWLGSKNVEKGITTFLHKNDFNIDEDALSIGSSVCVQFVLDNMENVNI